MTGPAKHYVDTPFGQVHYHRVDGAGPPVVLLHRTPVDSSSFDAVMTLLRGRRSAIALDTPGFGQSFRPQGSPAAADYGRWFLAALDALDVRTFHLFAHHTATHFAVEMAKAEPERVATLMLSGVLYADAAERAATRRAIGSAPAVEPDGGHLLAVWRVVKGLFPDYDPALVRKEALGALGSPQGCDQAFDAVLGQDFASVLAQVRCPLRVLQAEDDPLDACLDRVRADHPQIRVLLHGPAGIAAPERQAAAIFEGILDFTGAETTKRTP